MATTYTLISSNTLSSSAASVTFSSIPSTYTDLVLKVSARSSRADTLDYLKIQINSITSGYSDTYLTTGSAASPQSARDSSSSIFGIGATLAIPGSNGTTNTFGSFEMYIPSYTVSQNKPMNSIAVAESNSATASTYYITSEAELLSNTATVSSITITPYVGPNFLTSSSFYLYGVKKS